MTVALTSKAGSCTGTISLTDRSAGASIMAELEEMGTDFILKKSAKLHVNKVGNVY